MKKLISKGMLVIFCVVFSAASMAKVPKPPKELCLDRDDRDQYLLLAIKKGLNVRTAEGKLNFYTVQGSFFDGPENPNHPFAAAISGTGYRSGMQQTDIAYLPKHSKARSF
jgi:hypothetical protein